METGLTGRTALVTGASRGIGAGIAEALVAEGVRVALCARPSDALSELAARLSPLAKAVPVDARDPEAVTAAVAAANTGDGLDILVNNVGGAARFAGFDELDDADWLDAYDLNVLSIVRFTRAALPLLRQSPAARIINIGSVSAVEPGAYNPHYTAAKAAMLNLSKQLAGWLAPDCITVNAVVAGPVRSASWDRNVERTATLRSLTIEDAAAVIDAEEAAKVPLGRIGNPSDVASAVVFLASDRAAWTTGATYEVDGGKRRSIS